MNIKTGLCGVTLTSAFLLMVSCGGSDSNSGGGGGSSSAGKATGGSSNTAGTSNNSAGTTSNNGGTSNNNGGTSNSNGGTRPTGGFPGGGNFNFGGAGLDPEDYQCDPKPTVGSDCVMDTQPCADGTNVCYCQQLKWACIDLGDLGEGGASGGGGPAMCPAQAPMNGDACSGFAVCPYGGNTYCGCLGATWMCN